MKTSSGGMYNWIGEPVFKLLQVLGDGLFDNFGLAIIAFTLITRFLLLPLSIKQFRSARDMQKKMKAIKPRIEALKKKYKKDARKQMQEQMKLYKEAGISPLGCLTSPMYLSMLIQFPFLIAMISGVAYGARRIVDPLVDGSTYSHAESVGLNVHFLWLDLTKQDPYYIIPVVVAIMMFFSQRMMQDIAEDDPQAKMMRNIMNITMPLFFLWICAANPSGLGLYWFATTLITLGVQYYVKRGDPAPAGVTSKASPEASVSPPERDALERAANPKGKKRMTASTGESELSSRRTQVLDQQVISPERHHADITGDDQTSDWKEQMQDGQRRSKRKKRRRGNRERSKADGSGTGGSGNSGLEEG